MIKAIFAALVLLFSTAGVVEAQPRPKVPGKPKLKTEVVGGQHKEKPKPKPAIPKPKEKQAVPEGYIDLGLPSKTLWKERNEEGFYNFDEAAGQFGEALPNQQDWTELRMHCDWRWTGSGYNVVGPNGRSVYFSTNGFRGCSGRMNGVGERGDYWTGEAIDEGKAWFFDLGSGRAGLVGDKKCNGLSVRLVSR